MSGFGSFAFGAGPIGAGSVLAYAESAHFVAVDSIELWMTEGSDPGLVNPMRVDSVFYWRNWAMLAIHPSDAQTRLVRTVSWDPDTYRMRLVFDGNLAPSATYELSCAIATFCLYIVGIGTFSDAVRRDVRDQVVQDWAKPERQRDTQGGSIGTYQFVGGDLGMTSGGASLYERIVRRAQSIAGEMVHDPDYGMNWRMGGLLRIDALQRYQSRLTAQIKRDPDVVSARVSVGIVPDEPGLVSVSVFAETVDGPVGVATRIGRS